MADPHTPAPPPSGYDTVLQVLADMRREQAERDEQQRLRDEETHRLLEAVVGALEAHDGTMKELLEAAKPPKPGEGKSLKDALREAFGDLERNLSEKIEGIPDGLREVLNEPAPAGAE